MQKYTILTETAKQMLRSQLIYFQFGEKNDAKCHKFCNFVR